MSAHGHTNGINVPESGPPVVALQRIRQIQTYEVMESDLVELDRAFGDESQALGFWTASGGIAGSAALAWYTATNLAAGQTAAYAVFTAISLLAGLWFFFTWLRAKRVRPGIVARMRQRPELQVPPAPPRASPAQTPPKA